MLYLSHGASTYITTIALVVYSSLSYWHTTAFGGGTAVVLRTETNNTEKVTFKIARRDVIMIIVHYISLS